MICGEDEPEAIKDAPTSPGTSPACRLRVHATPTGASMRGGAGGSRRRTTTTGLA